MLEAGRVLSKGDISYSHIFSELRPEVQQPVFLGLYLGSATTVSCVTWEDHASPLLSYGDSNSVYLLGLFWVVNELISII